MRGECKKSRQVLRTLADKMAPKVGSKATEKGFLSGGARRGIWGRTPNNKEAEFQNGSSGEPKGGEKRARCQSHGRGRGQDTKGTGDCRDTVWGLLQPGEREETA